MWTNFMFFPSQNEKQGCHKVHLYLDMSGYLICDKSIIEDILV